MDATNEFSSFNTRRDTVGCAALLLAMVVSALCGAFAIDAEASIPAAPAQTAIHTQCPARGISVL